MVLGLDTSTAAVSAAVAGLESGVEGGEVDARPLKPVERSVVALNRHGELLAPLIGEVLHEAGVDRTGLAAVAVGLGPGPFTGLRVGIVTAATIADALGIPAYGVCSLDAMAPAVADAGQPFAAVTDARRKQVYWARYDERGRRVDGPDLARPDDLAERLRDDVSVVVGAGAVLYAQEFAAYTVIDGYPTAAGVIALVADRVRHGDPSDVLEPMYLRRPDARPPGAPKKVTPA